MTSTWDLPEPGRFKNGLLNRLPDGAIEAIMSDYQKGHMHVNAPRIEVFMIAHTLACLMVGLATHLSDNPEIADFERVTMGALEQTLIAANELFKKIEQGAAVDA